MPKKKKTKKTAGVSVVSPERGKVEELWRKRCHKVHQLSTTDVLCSSR